METRRCEDVHATSDNGGFICDAPQGHRGFHRANYLGDVIYWPREPKLLQPATPRPPEPVAIAADAFLRTPEPALARVSETRQACWICRGDNGGGSDGREACPIHGLRANEHRLQRQTAEQEVELAALRAALTGAEQTRDDAGGKYLACYEALTAERQARQQAEQERDEWITASSTNELGRLRQRAESADHARLHLIESRNRLAEEVASLKAGLKSWADAATATQAKLEQAEADLSSARKQNSRSGWAEWARRVMLDGITESATTHDLQVAICRRFDDMRADLRTAAQQFHALEDERNTIERETLARVREVLEKLKPSDADQEFPATSTFRLGHNNGVSACLSALASLAPEATTEP